MRARSMAIRHCSRPSASRWAAVRASSAGPGARLARRRTPVADACSLASSSVPVCRWAPITSWSSDSAISIAPLAIAASAACPFQRMMRAGTPEPLAWKASAGDRVRQRRSVAPLLDDITRPLVQRPSPPQRQSFVGGDTNEIVAEPNGVALADHQVTELIAARSPPRRVRSIENPTGERRLTVTPARRHRG